MDRNIMRGTLFMRHSDLKRYILRTVRIAVFITLILFLWLLVRDTLVMKRDDGITSMKILYEQEENSIDVLFIGSSHACYNIAAEDLYDQYGISYYQLWGSSQPFWSTYHFLVEALKTQKPKVVIMDVFGAETRDEYSDEARQATNTLGLNISLNQIENIMASAPEERWLELFLGLPVYHDRFSELQEGDFSFYPWSREFASVKGGGAVYGTHEVVELEYKKSDECIPLTEKQETYLRRIISLCDEQNTDLLLVLTPTPDREKTQGYYNSVKAIAEETGTVFINMNELDAETGLESKDFSYDDSHLNLSGARKTAEYLGRYLTENYDLEDHRNDPSYDGWREFSEYKKLTYLPQITDPLDYFNELTRQDYSALIISTGDWNGSELEADLKQAMMNSGFSLDLKNEGRSGIYLRKLGNAELLSDDNQTVELIDTAIDISFDKQTVEADNGFYFQWHKSGIMILVYDEDSKEWLDAVYMPEENRFLADHIAKQEKD